MAEPILTNATISFRTLGEDKDGDTGLKFLVEDRFLRQAASRGYEDFGHFDDDSDNGPFDIYVDNQNNHVRSEIQMGTVQILFNPNGHDKWHFNATVVLEFSDGSQIKSNQDDNWLVVGYNEKNTVCIIPIPFDPNLTGIWNCSDDYTYYIRQDGLSDIIWYRESVVGVGHIDGHTIRTHWVDVPKGGNQGAGYLTLDIMSNTKIELKNSEPLLGTGDGKFSGSIWWR
jgi:hypothetical protein